MKTLPLPHTREVKMANELRSIRTYVIIFIGVSRTPVWSVRPFLWIQNLVTNFGEFVCYRKDVTKMMLHTWRLVFADSIILWTRMPFNRRPISCLLIETQTFTIWRWDDLDLVYDLDVRHVKPTLTDVQVAKLAFYVRWPWLKDLDTQTWPRYCQDVPPHQKWSFYVNYFKISHTDTAKTLPSPHTREVITPLFGILYICLSK